MGVQEINFFFFFLHLKHSNVYPFTNLLIGFPSGSLSNVPANEGNMDLIPGLGRSPGQANVNPLQYLQDSCLGNPTNRGSW